MTSLIDAATALMKYTESYEGMKAGLDFPDDIYGPFIEAIEAENKKKETPMTQFGKALVSGPINCDICGEIMHPMYGGGRDNDRIVCADWECQAEITFPTSTEMEE